MLNFVSCLLDSNFIFRFVVVHSPQVHLVWLYDHHLRRVLVASNRPPFVLIRSYILDTSRAASDCSAGKTVPRYPPRVTTFSVLSPRYSWSLRSWGRPIKRWAESFEEDLKGASIPVSKWHKLAQDKENWKDLISEIGEESKKSKAKKKRTRQWNPLASCGTGCTGK